MWKRETNKLREMESKYLSVELANLLTHAVCIVKYES